MTSFRTFALTYSPEKKHILAIRLANELEDHLDIAMAYTAPERIRRRFESYGKQCIELALR